MAEGRPAGGQEGELTEIEENNGQTTPNALENDGQLRPLLVLFDGNAIVHRAYHALPPLSISKTGEVVGAAYGFASMLLKTINDLKPTCCAIAFDRKAPTFRHDMFEQYKAHRPRTPDELVNQFARVRQIVRAFGIPVYELDGYEADDVLGTLGCQATEQGIETVIVTGDADIMQLVSPGVRVLYPRPKGSFSDTILYGEQMVVERYGVKPEHIPDLKALVGDPSDNIPGVSGIGPKTAVKLIQQFGTIEEIYSRISEIMPLKLRETLMENEEIARQCKVLAKIATEAPVTLDLDKCQTKKYDPAEVSRLFRELEFFTLLSRLPQAEEIPSAPPGAEVLRHEYRTISTLPALEELLGKLSAVKSIALNIQTNGQSAMQAQVVGIALSPVEGEAYYIPVGHIGWSEQLPLQPALDRLRPLTENPAISKIAHNGKFYMIVLAEHGVEVHDLNFDSMIAAYLLGEKSLSLQALAFSKLGLEIKSPADVTGTGARQIPFSNVLVDRAAEYACTDADVACKLEKVLGKELHREELWRLFAEVEIPLVPVLVSMERHGIALDSEQLHRMSYDLGEQLTNLEKQIYANTGHEFNINSPQQLSAVLFQELRLPTQRKTKGKYSTGAAVLEELRGVHPIIDLIMEYRQLAKLKSTYIDTLPGLINPKTGRVHTSFNQTRTSTGRLSSSDPNLQNIPIRGELAKKIRQAFIAPTGSCLLAGDYSQIDLRVLAHLSRDPRLLQAFQLDEDIHSATAAQIFGVGIRQVTPDMRRVAKTVNFGVIYGMSDYGLEQATELSRQQASRFIDAYFTKYSGVKNYLESTLEQARRLGYVQTLLGRRRFIPEINSPNRMLREAAERMAINMPVQGTSADIIKVAMIQISREMQKRQLKSKLLLQVHDELVFEVPDGEIDEMRRIMPEIMCTAVELSIPLKVDIKAGKSWGDME